jgi:hypothetical protein
MQPKKILKLTYLNGDTPGNLMEMEQSIEKGLIFNALER